MKKVLLAFLFTLSVGFVLAQSNGSYRSRQSGDWNQVTTWQVFNSGWRDLETSAAGIYQNTLPSYLSGVITVSSNTVVTIPNGFEVFVDQLQFGTTVPMGSLQVASGGILSIINGSGHDVRLYNNGSNFSQLLVSGLLRLHSGATIVNDNYAGTVLPASHSTTFNTYKVLNGGIHVHASADGIPYAEWQTGSTIIYYATNANPIIADVSVQFYNFIWDGRAQSQDLSFSGRLRNINGTFTINKTNNHVLHLGTNSSYTLNIGGNFDVIDNSIVSLNTSATAWVNIGTIVSPSNFQISAGAVYYAGNGTTTVVVSGDFVMSGGTSILRNQTGSGSGVTSLNVIGDFSQTGGTITRTSGAGSTNINFTGSGSTSIFSKTAGTISNAINFGVAAGKILDLGTSALTGSGNLYVYPSATLHVKSLDAAGAIQNNTTGGNVRLTGTKTYNSGSTIVYDATSAQFIGSGHPTLPNTIINNPTTVTMVSAVTIDGNLTITDGVFDAGSNNTLRLNSNFVVDDTFEAQQGLVRFGGSAPQSISGSSNITFFDLEINQTASTSLTIGTNTAIENSLDVNSVSSVEAGNELLTLVSNSTRTAYVAPLATGAAINGVVVVERHLPNNAGIEAYRYLAPPTVGSFVSDWQDEIPITGTFDNPSTGPGIEKPNSPSMFIYDETFTSGGSAFADRYRDYPTSGSSTVAPLQNGRGYSVYVRNTGAVIMDTRGTLGQGPVPVSVTNSGGANGGWNLIGNPYPAPIDWDAVAASLPIDANVYNAIYFSDRVNNGNNNGVVAYINGVGTPASYDGIIAQGQAFFVNATGSETITFQESHKFNGQTQFFRKEEISNLLRIVVNGMNASDEVALRLHEEATDLFDRKFDALEFPGDPEYLDLSMLTANNEKVVINAVSSLACGQTIPLLLEKAGSGDYTFNFSGKESFDANLALQLHDKHQDQVIDISKTNQYSFTVSDPTTLKDRFEIVIGKPTIETDLEVAGTSFCEANPETHIVIKNSQSFVKYSVQWSDQNLSDEILGNGADLEIPLNIGQLPSGEQEVSILATMNACSSEQVMHKIQLNLLETEIIKQVEHGTTCGPGVVRLNVRGDGAYYNWYEDLQGTSPIVNQTSSEYTTPVLSKSKTYFVAAVNSLGCEGERVAINANVVYMDSVNIEQDGLTLTSSYDEGNTWYLDGAALENGNAKQIEVLNAGVYSVTVINQGCKTTAFKDLQGLTFEEGINILVYPNPTSDKVTIEVKSTSDQPVAKLISAAGVELNNLVLKGAYGKHSGELELLTYPAGIYLIQIQDGQKIYLKKVFKSE